MPKEQKLKVTVCGSMNKYWNEMRRVIEEFNDLGAEVPSPALEDFYIERKGSLILATSVMRPLLSERGLSGRQIEDVHINSIRTSNACYLVIPDGILGIATGIEAGVAIHDRVPLFASNPYESAQEITSSIKSITIVASPMQVIEDLKLIRKGLKHHPVLR
jgi:hypothetical protein